MCQLTDRAWQPGLISMTQLYDVLKKKGKIIKINKTSLQL